MKHRPSPSLLVAVLALLVAASGAGYAAATIGSAQIKDNSVQSVDIKNKTITANDVKAGSLTASVLKKDCPTTSLKLAGVCFVKKTNAKKSLQGAINTCHVKGGRIASYNEIRLLPTVNGVAKGVTWSDGMLNQYEFTSTYVIDGSLHVLSADYSGNVLTMDDGLNRSFHCVTYP